MEGVRPCPYCGGEVEVIKLNKTEKDRDQYYRLQCMKCQRTVAKGLKFEKETAEEGKERIKDYEAYMVNLLKR